MSKEKFKLNYLPSKVEGEGILVEVFPTQLSYCKFTIFIILSIFLAGIPLLIVYIWYSIPYLGSPASKDSTIATAR